MSRPMEIVGAVIYDFRWKDYRKIMDVGSIGVAFVVGDMRDSIINIVKRDILNSVKDVLREKGEVT